MDLKKLYRIDLDLRQLAYLETIVDSDFSKCKCCDHRKCGLSKLQCESFKAVKREVYELIHSF